MTTLRNNSSSDDKNIAEAQKITSISNFQNLTSKDVEEISTFHKDGKLNDDQLNSIIKEFPESFTGAVRELIGTLRNIVESSGDAQKDGMQALASSLEYQEKTLLELAPKIETDQARIEFTKLIIELADSKIEISKMINHAVQDNNSFWGKIFMGAGSLVAMALAIVWRGSDGEDA